jgi:PAS domain-containing protein
MNNDATQVLPPPSWSDPRIHLLDDSWLLTIFAILLATALPWLLSGFAVNFAAACLGLLALGAIHFVLSALGRRSQPSEPRRAMTALHLTGILIIAFIWLNAGGLQNPAFLTVFALPVIGAVFLSRWQSYVTALMAIVLAGAVALAQIPELRWYAPGFGAIGAWLNGLQQFGGEGPFRGFYAPSGYYIVLLQVFALLLLACAVASEYLGTIFERLHAHLDAARADVETSQAFWSTLIEDLPLPAFLVDPDTLRIITSSERARAFCSTPPAQNRSLLETVRFSYPDVVQELICADGGRSPLSLIHVDDRLLAAEVQVQHITQNGRRVALVAIDDRTEDFMLRAALDVSGQATLVIDAAGRVVEFNKPALALFAGLQKNAEAAGLLSLAGKSTRWWEPGLSGRRKMHVEIAPRLYQVTTSALPLPADAAQLYVVAFLPVARSAIADSTAVTATVQIPEPLMTTRSHPTLASHK